VDSGDLEGGTMAMVTDPVCGMRIDADDAVASAEHDGRTFYFCSQTCHDVFIATPDAFVSR
jgi:Cu+-exporting ATPase